MRSYDTLIVGLALDSSDESTLEHAVRMSDVLDAKELILAHVLPDSGSSFFNKVAAERLAQLHEVGSQLRESGQISDSVRLTPRVINGTVAQALIKLSKESGADLVIVGRTGSRSGSRLGMEVSRLVVRLGCSVMIVPRGQAANYERVMVPVDFSSHAEESVQVAIEVANSQRENVLIVQHIYDVPLGFHHSGKTYEEFAENQKQLALKEWGEFRGKVHNQVLDDLTLRLDLDPESHISRPKPSRLIAAAVDAVDASIVVIGSRGRSAGAAMLLGSTAARVVADIYRPILVVKKKGENLGLLDALFSL